MTSIPPRLRAPVKMAVGGLIVLAVGGAVYGWVSALYFLPVVLAVVVGLFVWAGRDSDSAAVVRRQPDERQAEIRLKVQALVGRVLSVAVAIGYLVAVAVKAPLWPFAILLGLLAIAFLAGWLIYREDGHRRDNSSPTEHI